MQDIPLWNQSRLPCPSTSAHKIDLSVSSHCHGILSSFLTNISGKPQKLKEFLVLLTSEVVILKRFFYKIASVFAHDKSYKMLKHIHKSVNKLIETDLVSDLTNFVEQHSVCFANVMFIAPKPKYEYVQVRLQGIVKLIARILCLCQSYGSTMIQKMRLGHFVHIVAISMSSAARIWALSLHIMYFLMKLYDEISIIFKTEGLIPASTVRFLPEDYILPFSLEHWLKSDETLKDMHSLLMKKQKKENTSMKKEIWQTIKIYENEREQLLQLKELVTSSAVTKSGLKDEVVSLDKFNFSADIGEPVSRKTTAPVSNNKGKRTKKLKGNELEN